MLEQRQGVNVYVGPAYLYYNTNPFAVFPGFQVGDELYAKVDYFDEGFGNLRLQYDSVVSNFDQTEFHTRSTRVDTQQFVSSYHYLENVQFQNGSNGHDFRLATWGLPVRSVTISDEPFQESGLEWAWAPPWESPYAGPSRPVDASTLTGKVLAGYQGWFNTPNDAADEGYVHWGVPGDWSIEKWPDPNDYDSSELFAVPNVTTASGEQAYLFSSANASVVDRHFQWMRQHDIDGVFVQRFRGSFMKKLAGGDYTGEPQWPVVNARDAAHREGRTWAIEYDIQNGGSPAERDQVIQNVKDDWEYLTDPNGMDMLNDSHYQHHDGKPVVAIFGLYVSDTNAYSTAQQAELISYFQSRGIYVIGAGRHSQSAAQIGNAGLHDAYIPWQGYWAGGNSYAPADAALAGVTEHIPHVFPGFSWTHLKNSSTATSRDREEGNFYWRMLSDAVNETDAPWLFIGMFDEYDEGTNLIPATDDPPVPDTDSGGNPLTYQVSDPMPNDWWMALTGAAKQALQGKVAINDTIPTESDLENRSNVGGEARWQVETSDRLTSFSTVDSQVQTAQFTVAGTTFQAIYSVSPYLHFQVDDGFIWQAADGRDVTIEVEYLDSAAGQFHVEYDSPTANYKATTQASLTGSGEWRTHRFEIADASFGNGQTGSGDFRLVAPQGELYIRRASVIKENALSVDASLGATNAFHGLQLLEYGGDSQTVPTSVAGRDARLVNGTPSSRYLYMQIDDNFAHQVRAGLNAVIEVVYLDVGTGNLNVQYDSTGAVYESANAVTLENSGEWRTARFYVDDALFANRQNGGADFRISGTNIAIDRVRVLRSFGDLVDPQLQSTNVMVNPAANNVVVSWTMTDDWKSGLMDQWTPQEDNQVIIEWTNDGGATWHPAGKVFEHANPTSLSGFDTATGESTWSDEFTWSVAGRQAGTYQLRLTAIDGRGNTAPSIQTAEFEVDPTLVPFGDYNADGVVNLVDYTIWRDNMGASVPPYTSADGSGNGIVGHEDYAIWKTNFGASLTPLALTEESPTEATPLAATLAMSTLYSESEDHANVLTPQAIDGAFALDLVSADESAEPSLLAVVATPLEADRDQLLLLLASEHAAIHHDSLPAEFDVTETSQADASDSCDWLGLDFSLGDM